MEVNPAAIEIAATEAGLRPDQVQRAVELYRRAAAEIMAEPEWQSVMHISGGCHSIAQYVAEGTAVSLQIDSWEKRGEWRSERRYVYKENAYEHFAEARHAEMAESARMKPYAITTPPGAEP